MVIVITFFSCDSGPFLSNYAKVRQLYPNARIYHEGDQSQANQAYWTVIDSTGEYYRVVTDGGNNIYVVKPIEIK